MGSKRKILIVENEFIIADKLQEILQENGYDVLPVVDNYEDAILHVREHLPDLALLDIHINGKKDGIELAEYIYTHYRIPVIFLSAFSDPETIRRAKAAHPNCYLVKSKPFIEGDNLIRVVESQLLVSIHIAMPDEEERKKLKLTGFFAKVKEVDFSKRKTAGFPEDPVDKETLLKYDDIAVIESNNKNEHNTVLVRLTDLNKAYILRKTMKEIEQQLPAFFVRIHDSYIVNLHKVTASRLPHRLFIGELLLTIGDKFRDATIEKLNSFFGS
jgi:DNA-binding LytR/AlgR family response regulator